MKRSIAVMLAGSSFIAAATVSFAQAGPAKPSDVSETGAQTPDQALAQAEADADEQGKARNEIVVTGTQIRGATPAGSTLLTATAAQVEEQGATNGNEILAQLPQAANFFQGLPSMGGLGGTTAALVAIARLPSQGVTLRNLPSGSVNLGGSPTLTLIDGHRVVPSGTDVLGGQNIDNSLIASSGILRTEIMPDGASAIYGSDAVVGVINYITRDSFDGIEAQARAGFARNYLQYDASVTAGTKWSTGSIFGSFAYSFHDPLLGRDRPYLAAVDANPSSPLYNTPLGLNCDAPNIAITSAVGAVQSRRLYPLAGLGGAIQPYTTNSGSSGNGSGGGGNTNGIAGGNRCNNGDYNSNYPEEKRYNAIIGLRQELSDSLTFGLKAWWSRRESKTYAGSTFSATIAANNPNYRPVCRAPANPQPAGPICGVTPGFEAGDDVRTQTIFTNLSSTLIGPYFHSYVSLDTWQIAPTVSWDFAKDWQLRALFTYGESTTRGIQGILNTSTTLQSRINSGQINPYTMTGAPGAFDGILQYGDKIGKFALTNAKVVADGPVFSLPGGEVRVAVGAEYIKTAFSILQTGTVNSNTPDNFQYVNPVDGSINPLGYTQTVKAAFGEVKIPLVGTENSLPLINSLELSASARFDRYNDFGDTFNYMLGVNWGPTSWIKLRGNYNTSFAAPSNIVQLGTVTGAQAQNLNCNGPQGSLCSSAGNGTVPFLPGYYSPGIYTGGIQAGDPLPPGAQIAQVGARNQTQPTGIALIMTNGTVPGLGPQKSKNWSVGFDVEPPIIPGLSFGMGYYNLVIRDQIAGIGFGAQNTWNTRPDMVYCHNGVKGNDPNAAKACTIPLSLAELTTPGPNGWLVPITQGGQTIPSSLNSIGGNGGSGSNLLWSTVLANYCGPDVYPNCPANSYSVFSVADNRTNNMSAIFARGLDFRASYRTEVPWGSLDARVAGTVSLGMQGESYPGAPKTDLQQYDVSTLRVSASLGTTSGGFRGQVTWQHSAGYDILPTSVGTPGTATVPGTGAYGQTRVGAYNTFDLFFRYDFDSWSNKSGLFKDLQLTLNVNNIFDTDPPRVGGGFGNGLTLGRMFQIGLRKRFGGS